MTVNFGGFKNAAAKEYLIDGIVYSKEVCAQVTGKDKKIFQPLMDFFPTRDNDDFIRVMVPEDYVPLDCSKIVIRDSSKSIKDLKVNEIPYLNYVGHFLEELSKQKDLKFDLSPEKALKKMGLISNFDDISARNKSIKEAFNPERVVKYAKQMEENFVSKINEFFSKP